MSILHPFSLPARGGVFGARKSANAAVVSVVKFCTPKVEAGLLFSANIASPLLFCAKMAVLAAADTEIPPLPSTVTTSSWKGPGLMLLTPTAPSTDLIVKTS